VKCLWLFPGQGGQSPGMLKNIDPDLKTEVESWTGVKLRDSLEGYQDSQQIQLSILLLQVNEVDQLKKMGWHPDLVAGHSLGVFGAAYAANVITKENVFKLVNLRAKLMQSSYPAGYGMGVIVGLSRQEVADIVKIVHTSENPVFLSNQNSELQNTLSGKLSAIKQVLELATKSGATKAKLLRVPNPSHSTLMAKVAKKLSQAIEKLHLKDPECIYLANNNGRPVKKVEEVKYDLANNLIHPVFWETMINVALEYNPQVSLEFSPGNAFTKLLKVKTDQIANIVLSEMSVSDADYLLNKWKG